jgi:formamidopyrimidine-DNA glycosylase
MIIFSLGMTGRIQFTQGPHSNVWFDLSKSTNKGKINLLTPNGSLYFDDTRRMGNVEVITHQEIPYYFSKLGPDLLALALDEKTWISLENWLTIFSLKRLQNKEICQILLDQDLVAGIGNYLKSEILYYAGVAPQRIVSTITKTEWDRIRICAHKIILLSYSYGGLTIESFISPDGSPGRYPKAVYGNKQDPSGNPVIRITTKDNRSTFWVPNIQS